MSGPLAVLVTIFPGALIVIGSMYVLNWLDERKDRVKSRSASTTHPS